MEFRDELGFRVEVNHPPARVVSLVPSLTETLFALGLDDEVVGVTRFCIAPEEKVASRTKIGGTKNPKLREIIDLAPDLVVANAEENRREDVEHLRSQGLAVYVTYPRTVPAAVESIIGLGRVLGRDAQAGGLAREIVRVVSGIETAMGAWTKLRLRVFCPIWKNPWMAFNADTYPHDVLRMLGFNNVYASAGERYPRTTLEAALERNPDVVLLPDEPYAFGASDIDELKASLPPALARRMALISGRDLHWYGVHMVTGLATLSARLSKIRAAVT